MFLAQLYEFPKKHNSTKIPSGNNTVVNIVLKAPTSVLNPIFELDFGNSNPSHYNYCYIAQFRRYYFIEDWTYNGRLWEANCSVDPLASWKSQIGNSNLYVLRSASDYDPNVVDTSYPAKNNVDILGPAAYNSGFDYTDGIFVLGTMSRPTEKNGTNQYYNTFTGMSYYVLSASELCMIRDNIFPDLTNFKTSTIEQIASVMLCNPMDFVTSLMWFPMDLVNTCSTWLSDGKIFLGYWSAGVIGARLLDETTWTHSFVMTPQVPIYTRGKWEVMSPFCRYRAYVPYFGSFELPSDLVANDYAFNCIINVSLVTGVGTLKVIPYKLSSGSPPSTGVPCIVLTAQIGTQAQLAGASINVGNMINSGMEMVKGAGEIATGNPLGFLDMTKGGIGTISGSIYPTVMGTAGGNSELFTNAYTITEKYTPVDDDNANRGKPLCKNKTINTLSGFIQVMEGDVSIACTQQERDQIKNYLEGGFFYE